MGVYEDYGALQALAPAWDRLAETPMQQSIWAQAWAETMGKGHRMRISTAGPPDSPSAIAALVSGGRSPVRFELLGSDLYEPVDVLGGDEGGFAAIAEELARVKAPLLLRRVPAESAFVSAVSEAYSGSLVVVRRAPGTPYFALDEGSLEPENRFNAGRRSDLRRARRRAEALGEVAVDVLCPAAGELGGLLDETFRVEAAGWKSKAGTALGSDPLRAAFYRRYAELAARRGILRLCFLRIDGQAVGVQLAVELAGRFWLLKIGYDEAFSRCSPGTLLMIETVRFAAARGLEQYELLGEPEAWTTLWTESEHDCVSVRTYTPGFSGLGALAIDGASLAGRRWRARRARS